MKVKSNPYAYILYPMTLKKHIGFALNNILQKVKVYYRRILILWSNNCYSIALCFVCGIKKKRVILCIRLPSLLYGADNNKIVVWMQYEKSFYAYIFGITLAYIQWVLYSLFNVNMTSAVHVNVTILLLHKTQYN